MRVNKTCKPSQVTECDGEKKAFSNQRNRQRTNGNFFYTYKKCTFTFIQNPTLQINRTLESNDLFIFQEIVLKKVKSSETVNYLQKDICKCSVNVTLNSSKHLGLC